MPMALTRRIRAAAKAFFGSISDATTYIRLGSRALKGDLDSPYSQSAWVRRAVTLIAKNLCQLPFIPEEGEAPNIRRASNEDLDRLWDDPNPEMTRAQFMEATNLLLDLEGNCIWYAPGRDNVSELPDELWPMPKKNWEPVRKKNRVVAWRYHGDGAPATVMPWNVIHLKLYDPRNLFWGISPLEAAKLSAQVDYQALKMASRSFENDTTPGGILRYKGGELDDEKYEQYRQQWTQRHGGDENTRKLAIVDGNLDYEPIPADMTKMEASQGRILTREDIMAAFGVPPEVAGLGRTTFNNRSEAMEAFWHETLLPRATYIAEMANERLVQPATGNRIKMRFDTANVPALQGNVDQKVTTGKALHGSGVPWVEVNRRLDLKLERFPGDDVAWMPFTVQAVGRDTEVGEPPAPAEPTDLPPEPPPEPEDPPEPADPEGDGTEPDKAPGLWGDEKWRAARWKMIAKQVLEPNERRLVGRMKKFFFRQGAATIRRLREIAGREPKTAGRLTFDEIEQVLFAEDTWNAELEKLTRPVMGRLVTDVGSDLEDTYGLTFDARQPVFAEFLDRKLQRFASDVNETTLGEIRAALVEGVDAGETVTELSVRVRDVFTRANESRALTIARTETAEAANGVRFLVFDRAGIKKHAWLSARDGEVRETHAAEDGNMVDMGVRFPVTNLLYPGQVDGPPEEVINCRCVAEPVVGGES